MNQVNKEMIDDIKILIDLIKDKDFNEIYEDIKDFNEEVRYLIYWCAISTQNEEFAEKVKKINELLLKIKINKYKEEVNNNNQSRFLNTMSFVEKLKFTADLELQGVDTRYIDTMYYEIDKELDKQYRKVPKMTVYMKK